MSVPKKKKKVCHLLRSTTGDGPGSTLDGSPRRWKTPPVDPVDPLSLCGQSDA